MRGRGRGRGGRASFVRDATHQETPQIYLPRPPWPETTIPRKRPHSSREHTCVEHFRRFRKQMRDGPLYTVLDVDVQLQKPGELGSSQTRFPTKIVKSKTANNPFESMQTYSKRFSKPKRTLPKLDGRSYAIQYFPRELQSLIDPSIAAQSLEREKQKIKSAKDKVDEALNEDTEEEDLADIEQDNDYEQDELDDEDGDDDYNAEQYFDNGEDDTLEDDGGGDYD